MTLPGPQVPADLSIALRGADVSGWSPGGKQGSVCVSSPGLPGAFPVQREASRGRGFCIVSHCLCPGEPLLKGEFLIPGFLGTTVSGNTV